MSIFRELRVLLCVAGVLSAPLVKAGELPPTKLLAPQLAVIAIVTSNPDAMLAFYSEVLGMPVRFRDEGYVELSSGGIRVALVSSAVMHAASGWDGFGRAREKQPYELALEVATAEEVDRFYQRAVAAGARSVRAPTTMAWGQRAAYFADPDGNVLDISSKTQ